MSHYSARALRHKFSAVSLAELSAKFNAARDAGLRNGSIRKSTPYIDVLKDGVSIGYMSWNGRIWKGKPRNALAPDYVPNECLFDPKGELV